MSPILWLGADNLSGAGDFLGKLYCDLCATAVFTYGAGDAAVVGLDDLAAQIQANSHAADAFGGAGTMMLDPKEFLENALAELNRNPRPAVRDRNLHGLTRS